MSKYDKPQYSPDPLSKLSNDELSPNLVISSFVSNQQQTLQGQSVHGQMTVSFQSCNQMFTLEAPTDSYDYESLPRDFLVSNFKQDLLSFEPQTHF